MTPAARIETTIHLLDLILTQNHIPMDAIVTNFFRKNRYIGSKDRKAIAEKLYQIMKALHSLTWYAQYAMEREKMKARDYVIVFYCLKEENKEWMDGFDGKNYHPKPLTHRDKALLQSVHQCQEQTPPKWVMLQTPSWLVDLFEKQFGDSCANELEALNQSAPFDLRINSLKSTKTPKEIVNHFQKEGIEAEVMSYSPWGVRFHKRRPLSDHPFWRDGVLEVQDEGSQLIPWLVDPKSGMQVLDFCAGAGGKTLALAALMKNKGQLIATDISAVRLKRSQERLKRAGVHNTTCKELDLKWIARQQGRFDRVLLDVPCSGVGTWRRNPDLKWKTTPNTIEELVEKQRMILTQAAPLVKKGGRLIYSTCSLLNHENSEQIDWFLKENPHFKSVSIEEIWNTLTPHVSYPGSLQSHYLTLTPYQHQTDGFFVAVLERL